MSKQPAFRFKIKLADENVDDDEKLKLEGIAIAFDSFIEDSVWPTQATVRIFTLTYISESGLGSKENENTCEVGSSDINTLG